MSERLVPSSFTSCDMCHTTVPGDHYPQLCVLPDGRERVLCMHCKVASGATKHRVHEVDA
jgi:hypothetical protein